jgi:hypothetical protein
MYQLYKMPMTPTQQDDSSSKTKSKTKPRNTRKRGNDTISYGLTPEAANQPPTPYPYFSTKRSTKRIKPAEPPTLENPKSASSGKSSSGKSNQSDRETTHANTNIVALSARIRKLNPSDQILFVAQFIREGLLYYTNKPNLPLRIQAFFVLSLTYATKTDELKKMVQDILAANPHVRVNVSPRKLHTYNVPDLLLAQVSDNWAKYMAKHVKRQIDL